MISLAEVQKSTSRSRLAFDPPPGADRHAYTPEALIDPGYLYRAAWIARVLGISKPARHVDVSDCPGLAAIASAFVQVDFYSPRPSVVDLPGLKTEVVDPECLPFETASLESISSAGVIERMGAATASALDELRRVLAPDGSLLLVCPVGKPHVEPEARRVYSFGQVLDAFEGFDLEEFSLIPCGGPGPRLLINPDERLTRQLSHGYGCFWFRRPI